MKDTKTTISIYELSNVTKLGISFLRTALDSTPLLNYVVGRRPLMIDFNLGFIQDLESYMYRKKSYSKLRNLYNLKKNCTMSIR